jgi:hypothetical protein
VIQKPPRNAVICIPTAAEKSKIETICEVVGYGFSEIENRFQDLDLNVYIKVQFLKHISEFLNTFLSQEAPASGGLVDNTFELALEAALVNEDEVTTPTSPATQTKEGNEVVEEFDPFTIGLTTPTTSTTTSTTTTTDTTATTSEQVAVESSSKQEATISPDEKKEEETEVNQTLESARSSSQTEREENGKKGDSRSEDNERADKNLVLPGNSNTLFFVEEKESSNFYVVLSEEKEVSLDHFDILERAKELAVSTILQLQTNINSLQIELTNTTENTAIRSGAAIANELKKVGSGQ